MPRLRQFEPLTLQALARQVRRLDAELANMRRLVRTASWQNQEWPISPAKSDGSGMTAISGSTPGSGTVTLYGFDGSSLSSRALDVTCYNMAGAVDADTWLLVTQDIFGRWWVVVENC